MHFFFFFASPWQWEPTGVSVLFCFGLVWFGLVWFLVLVFLISVLGFLGMVSIPLLPHSSWLFPSIVFHSTEISLGYNYYDRSALLLLCHLYKALLYVHDLELVEIGVWWIMSVCFFFFHLTRPKYREIKMKGGGGGVYDHIPVQGCLFDQSIMCAFISYCLCTFITT